MIVVSQVYFGTYYDWDVLAVASTGALAAAMLPLPYTNIAGIWP